MDATQIILPAVATFALGTALLVPLRDNRRGRRATLGGADVPLRPQFGARHIERAEHVTIDRTTVQSVAEPLAEPLGDAASDEPTSSSLPFAIDARGAERETPFAWLVRVGVRVFGIGERQPTVTAERRTGDALDGDVDRSFASELASLLDAATDRDRHADGHSGDGVRSERAREHDDRVPSVASAADDGSPTDRAPFVDSVTTPSAATSVVTFSSTTTASAASFDLPECPAPQPLPIAARVTAAIERVVPITRLPLRPHGLAITWTRDVVSIGDVAGPTDAGDRCAILERLLHEPGTVASDVVGRAYHEEEAAGRLLALRVLVAHYAGEARAVFVDALHTGTDDERALAVEGFAAGDARDALPAAFADRVEAIAARAALEYVGITDRATFRTALAPYVDAARLDALLLLLAGIVE